MATKQKKQLIEIKTHLFDNDILAIDDYSLNHSADDDKEYLNYDLWAQLPRGKAYVKDVATGETIAKLHGVPKFGADNMVYGKGLDDNWDTIVFTEKANGEAFHVSGFRHNGNLYAIGGSKNVHILVNLNDDVDQQFLDIVERQPKRVDYATKMLKAFLQLPNYRKVLDFCVSKGTTFVGEYINPEHEHIVDYDREHILFFAITHPDSLYTWCSPVEAQKIFKDLGVEAVEAIVGNRQTIDAIKEDFYNRKNSEGSVIYYVANGQTVYMQKYKNKQYTVLRTIREMYKSGAGLAKLSNRLNEYHLVLTDDEKKDYITFFQWLKQNKTADEPFSIRLWYRYVKSGKTLVDKSSRTVVLLVGLPGSGKTTVGTQLAVQMSLDGQPATYVDQDLYRSNPIFLANAFKDILFNKPEIQTVFHGKTNINADTRDKSLGAVTTESLYIIYLESTTEESVKRIGKRQFHYNLKHNDPKVKSTVASFKQSLQIPVDSEFSMYPGFKGILMINTELSVLDKLNLVSKFIGYNKFFTETIDFVWPSYIGIKLNRYPIDQKVLPIFQEKVEPEAPGLKKQDDYHITLLHSSDYPMYPQMLLDLNKLSGQVEQVIGKNIAYNQRIAAIEVSIKAPHKNKHPHITYARADGVSPYESNELLDSYGVARVSLGDIVLDNGHITLY